MKRILFVKTSLNGEQGASNALGVELVSELQYRYPGSTVTTLDLANSPLPHLDAGEFASWRVPSEERSPLQTKLAARSDALIEQLLAHDTLVLAVPMYNLTIPSTLKAWIDRVVRAGRTFRYTADGPEGLVRDIDAYAVFARGGLYRGTALDTQTAYIDAILGLIGIRNVKSVFAEGLAMGPESRSESLDEARDAIGTVVETPDRHDIETEVRYANA